MDVGKGTTVQDQLDVAISYVSSLLDFHMHLQS